MRNNNLKISGFLLGLLAAAGAISPDAASAQHRFGAAPTEGAHTRLGSNPSRHDSNHRGPSGYDRDHSRSYDGDGYRQRGSYDRDSNDRRGDWKGYPQHRGDSYARGPERYDRYDRGRYDRFEHGHYNPYQGGRDGRGYGRHDGYGYPYGGFGGWARPAYGYYGAPVIVAPTYFGWAVAAGNVFVSTAPVLPVYSGWAYARGR